MEISLDIFLFFWMEKKLMLLPYICNIEYLGHVLWPWSFKLNGNAIVQIIVLFVYLLIVKRAEPFLSSSISYYFSLFEIIIIYIILYCQLLETPTISLIVTTIRLIVGVNSRRNC